MSKTLIFMVLTFAFMAITAAGDTTFVCSQVGDWDQWSVPYADQVAMVQDSIVMEIYYDDEAPEQEYVIIAYAGSPNNRFNVCKGKDCGTPCKPPDYPDDCPCASCTTPADGTSVGAVCSYLVAIQ